MTKTQIKKIIKDDLTPRYERARDSRIDFTIKKAHDIKENLATLADMRKLERNKFNISEEDKVEYKRIYDYLYGEGDYETSTPKGIVRRLTDKEYKLIMDKKLTDRQLKSFFTAEYKETIKNLVQAIADEIEVLKPKNVESGYATEHDIHFILTMKDGARRSYTINTILAGGYVQVIHNRTLRKLHKGLAK